MPMKPPISFPAIPNKSISVANTLLDEEVQIVKGPDTPQGTIALLLVYVVIIVALWTNVYMTMLSRGITQ